MGLPSKICMNVNSEEIAIYSCLVVFTIKQLVLGANNQKNFKSLKL